MSCDFRALANEGVQKISPYVPGKAGRRASERIGVASNSETGQQ